MIFVKGGEDMKDHWKIAVSMKDCFRHELPPNQDGSDIHMMTLDFMQLFIVCVRMKLFGRRRETPGFELRNRRERKNKTEGKTKRRKDHHGHVARQESNA